jgi:hypothetical protein
VKIYVYKCVVDDGGAPCVDGDLLTLTICKPYIRSTAEKGDLIFAFGSNADTGVTANRLVYIAEVSRAIRGGAYFRDPLFLHRQDCIYEWQPDSSLRWKQGTAFHQRGSGLKSDVGEPPKYPKANALCCEYFRYFGKLGDDAWKREAPMLRTLVENLGQGHRVHFTAKLRSELLTLKQTVWRDHPATKTLGTPLHAPGSQMGNADADAVCVRICRPRCDYHCD